MKRIEEIDMLKGFAAINVAIGHLAFLGDAHLLYYRWIFQWHMIAFFFAAGFVFSDRSSNQPLPKYLWRRFVYIIIPALWFRVFQAAIDTKLFQDAGQIGNFINNIPSYLYHYSVEWFTPSLFFALFVLFSYVKLRKKAGQKADFLVLILLVFTPFLCRLYDNKIGRETLYLPLLPDSTLLGLNFVLIGYLAKQYLINWFGTIDTLWDRINKKKHIIIVAVGIVIVLWFVYSYRSEYAYENIAAGKLGDSETCFYFLGLFWVFVLLIMFHWLNKCKRLNWLVKYLTFVGRHSLGFYLLHIAINNIWKIIFQYRTNTEWQYWVYSIPTRLLYSLVNMCIVTIILLLSQRIKQIFNPLPKEIQ